MVNEQVLEVRLAEDERDDRGQQVGDQRRDNRSERRPDHDRSPQLSDHMRGGSTMTIIAA
jgi:hypothetical protein